MTSNNMVNIYLYTRYERFWHWMQTALILLLLVTGFELNGLFTLFGFKAAAEILEEKADDDPFGGAHHRPVTMQITGQQSPDKTLNKSKCYMCQPTQPLRVQTPPGYCTSRSTKRS